MSTETEIAAPKPLPEGHWKLDPVHSRLEFAVFYIVGEFRACFLSFDAKLDTMNDVPRLVGSAAVDSLQIGLPPFRDHVLGPDFFDRENHPDAGFASTAWRREGNRLQIDGDLTLRGVTHSVSAKGTISGPVDDLQGTRALGIELETTVDRHEFGFDWNLDLPEAGRALAPAVRLEANLHLKLDDGV